MAERNIVIPLEVGQMGLWGTPNMDKVPPQALIDAMNLTYENDTLQKEGGATKFNSTAVSGSPSIIGGHDWNHDGNTSRMVIVTDASKMWKASTSGGSFATGDSNVNILATGPDLSGELATFVEGGKEAAANASKLFIFTGQMSVQVLSEDGTSTSALASGPADWSGTNQPRFGAIHEGRLWAGGNDNDPHRMYYSTPTDQERFNNSTVTGAGSISIFPGESERLVGAISYRDYLVAFKHPRGIYLIDTTDSTIANWRVTRISRGIGCVGVRGYDQMAGDVPYIDDTGQVRLLSQTDEYGNDVGTRSLTDQFNLQRYITDNLTTAQHWRWLTTWYTTKRQLHFAVTAKGSNDLPNRRLILDLNDPSIARWSVSDRDNVVSMWAGQCWCDNLDKLYIGDDQGFVYILDQTSRSKDGLGYNAQWQTPHMDFSHVDPSFAYRRKNGQFLEVVAEPSGNWNLSVDVVWDDQVQETLQFNMGTRGAALGSFVIGTDALGGNSVIRRKKRMSGSGNRLSLRGRNSGSGQDFSIAKVLVHVTLGDERI